MGSPQIAPPSRQPSVGGALGTLPASGMTARVLSDAQDVTSVETTTKPIEVWLSRPQLEVTCRIVFPDGTAIAVGVDALSILGAQHEMTAWLFDQGYEPAGRWSTQDEHDRRAARTFRCHDPGSVWPGPPPGAPWQSRPSGPGPDPDPPRPAAPRIRRAAAPVSRGDREPANSPHAAETELRSWALANTRRDGVIRAASAAGISVGRIQEVTGIARTTIMRILGSPPRPATRRSP
jgi:hypothetical protein